MKKLEIQNVINERMGSFLEPIEFFSQDKKEGVFKRKFEWGFQVLSFSFINYLPYNIEFVSSLGIRINKVEDILNRFFILEKKYAKNSQTYGCSLIGLVQGSNNYSFSVFNYHQLDMAILRVKQMLEQKGFEFLNNNSSIKALEYYYNDAIEEIYLSIPNNILHGLILAKLVNRPNFDELIEFYSKYAIKFQPVSYYHIYNELVEYLTSSDLSEFSGYDVPR